MAMQLLQWFVYSDMHGQIFQSRPTLPFIQNRSITHTPNYAQQSVGHCAVTIAHERTSL